MPRRSRKSRARLEAIRGRGDPELTPEGGGEMCLVVKRGLQRDVGDRPLRQERDACVLEAQPAHVLPGRAAEMRPEAAHETGRVDVARARDVRERRTLEPV